MKIAIQHKNNSFSERWIAYCKEKGIEYKLVNCYQSDIIQQMAGCDALMWHFHQASPRDFLFAKQLLYSVQAAGKTVLPDFNTMWHFDDKVGQKYLLEAIGAPLVPSYVFYDKKEALSWAQETNFPKVFKLRGGAGSQNVKLAKTKRDAIKLIKKAFGRGFSQYDAWSNLKEVIRKFRKGKASFTAIIKGIIRLVYTTEFSRVRGKEKGYIYFQDFIPDNTFDIRIVVIGNKAFALKRMVREHDFRASGGGEISYGKDEIDIRTVEIGFEIAKKLKIKVVAFDFVFDVDTPLILEISYGFDVDAYDHCPGFWDYNLKWYAEKFNPQAWMVDMVVDSISRANE